LGDLWDLGGLLVSEISWFFSGVSMVQHGYGSIPMKIPFLGEMTIHLPAILM